MDERIYKMEIIDFSNCKENYKAYGGMAGSKLGIIYQSENWILKFPKNTRSMKNVEIDYTTSLLSEKSRIIIISS